jgi:uncharacterized DUF497 family protein
VAVTFDPDKEARNLAKHGISLARFADLRDRFAFYSPRAGEARWLALGFLDGVLHAAIYTERGEDERVISLRPASRRERKVYADAP